VDNDGPSPGRPRIAAIGRLDQRKGYCFFIQAAALVRRVLPEARFFIIGDGELVNELRNQIARLGLEGYVHLLGSRLDMVDLMPTFDLVVSAALWEGMPTVLLEAMACDVPVIATEVCREMVQTGRTGICVPAGDALALAQAIIASRSNEGFRQRTTAAAHQLASQWTTRATAARYAALYDSLLHRGGGLEGQ
jgi:glycosyltransferase involved in cell wall biosynthesis